MTDKITSPHVYQAITNVMATMAKEGIGKDRRNSQQGYDFRGIDDVYNTLCGVLAENRLVILPSLVSMDREERQTQKGGVLNYTILTVDFKLVSSLDGSTDTVRMVGEAMDSADKSSNKAQSAALKYAALQVFMIPTKGDNDADATTHDVAPKRELVSDADRDIIAGLAEATGTDLKTICDAYKVQSLKDLTVQQGMAAIKRLQAKPQVKEAA